MWVLFGNFRMYLLLCHFKFLLALHCQLEGYLFISSQKSKSNNKHPTNSLESIAGSWSAQEPTPSYLPLSIAAPTESGKFIQQTCVVSNSLLNLLIFFPCRPISLLFWFHEQQFWELQFPFCTHTHIKNKEWKIQKKMRAVSQVSHAPLLKQSVF